MPPATFQQQQARAQAWIDGMYALKGALETATVADQYEHLRERYVKGQIDLEDFAAAVAGLLLEGL